MNNYIELTNDSDKHLVFSKKGKYVVFFKNVSGDFVFEITAPDVELAILGIIDGDGKNVYNVHTTQHHKAPRSTSDLFIKGVFKDDSRLYYEGLIRIEKEGQNSHAYQKNQNLMLSPGAYVESKPYLEILANEVFCTHGSTTGKLNPDDIFYTQSRGLSAKTAQDMLVEGFVNEIHDILKEKTGKTS